MSWKLILENLMQSNLLITNPVLFCHTVLSGECWLELMAWTEDVMYFNHVYIYMCNINIKVRLYQVPQSAESITIYSEHYGAICLQSENMSTSPCRHCVCNSAFTCSSQVRREREKVHAFCSSCLHAQPKWPQQASHSLTVVSLLAVRNYVCTGHAAQGFLPQKCINIVQLKGKYNVW